MGNGYDKFEKILDIKGIKAAAVAKGTGLTPSVFSDWKSGKSRPKLDKIQKIARFLNVPIEYFSDDYENPYTPPSDEEVAKIALLGGLDSISDAGWEEIKAYAQFVKAREHIDRK